MIHDKTLHVCVLRVLRGGVLTIDQSATPSSDQI